MPSLVSRISDLATAVGNRIKTIEQRPVFRGSLTASQTLTNQAANTVNIASVTDSHNAWSNTTRTYTVPQTGWYLIMGRIRLMDNLAVGTNYGMSIDSAYADNINMTWATTVGVTLATRRATLDNQRLVYLTQGQTLKLFVFLDVLLGTNSISSAELSIIRVR